MTVCTFGSLISDLELWRCARQQVDLHSTPIQAIVSSTEWIDVLGAVDDLDGVNTWMAITLRILHLGRGDAAGSVDGDTLRQFGLDAFLAQPRESTA